MGYKSGREIDLAVERGEADCRASSDITVLRSPWPEWLEKRYMNFVVQQGPKKSRVLPQDLPTVDELATPQAKPVLNLMDVMLAYTEFDRPFAAPPGTPVEHIKTLREAFMKMLVDPGFSADAKKLVDWEGSSMGGEQLQKTYRTRRHPTAGDHQASEGDFAVTRITVAHGHRELRFKDKN
jgi:hypothetical protein